MATAPDTTPCCNCSRPTRGPDGVFCYNDPVAAGAIKAALELGMRVPEDIAIIGAGNVHYSDLLRVPLSTVDQSSSTIGEKAAELLAERMESKKPLPVERVFHSSKVAYSRISATVDLHVDRAAIGAWYGSVGFRRNDATFA